MWSHLLKFYGYNRKTDPLFFSLESNMEWNCSSPIFKSTNSDLNKQWSQGKMLFL